MSLSSIAVSNANFILPFSFFPGRRPRPWVSFITSGCYYDTVVIVVWHCPVIDGMALVHLAWQHRIVKG